MTNEQLLRRVKELEQRVKELEARPVQHVHHHYPPAIIPTIQPYYTPQPWTPPPSWEMTCGTMGSSGHQQ